MYEHNLPQNTLFMDEAFGTVIWHYCVTFTALVAADVIVFLMANTTRQALLGKHY